MSPTPERLFDGTAGAFNRADIRVDRPRESDRVDSADSQLARIGFRPVGDLVCTRFPDTLGRGYARPSGDTWGALFFGLIESSFDFVTQWPAAFLLTTLNARGEGDSPAKGMYVTRLPQLGFDRLADLFSPHDDRKSALASTLGVPLAAAPDLKAFAEAVDRSISRQLGK